jgi:DNA-binding NtrC family response regulator
VQVDVRVVAATNRDLEVEYKAGRFRKDLYFRLNVVTIQIPALRERKSDLAALVRAFLARFAPDENVQITPAAMECLYRYDWPGNVRELENCIERAIALGNRRTIDVHDLPVAIRDAGASLAAIPDAVSTAVVPESSSPLHVPTPGATPTDLEALERETIERVFNQVNGDKTLAGKMLGISRATLYRKLKRYNIGDSRTVSAAAGAQN